LRHWLRSRSRHYPRLTLLPLNLHLRPSPWLSLWLRLRSQRLRVWRGSNHRRLSPLLLRLFHLALVLNSRRLGPSQLLIVNHLLPGCFTLRLLLLTHHLSLVLHRWHWLTDARTLGSLSRYAFNSRLLHLLTAQLLYLFLRALITSSCLSRQIFDAVLLHLLATQLLHLLPGPPITSCCLSRQIRHLFLSGLLRGEIRRLRLRRWPSCCAFVS
jgi:hypothetical protein